MGLMSFTQQSQPVVNSAALADPVAKKKPSASALYGSVSGGVVAVLGGGATLLDDVKLLPKNCAKISVNQHAASVMPVDYAVCLDFDIAAKIREVSGCKIISQQNEADVDFVFTDEEKTDLCASFSSAIPAVLLAVKMGYKKVIVCGVDLYTSGKYFDGSDTPTKDMPETETHLDFWRGAKQALGKDAEKIKVMAASPLSAVFDSIN